MKHILKDLELDEVSLVGSPANNRRFLLFKSMNKGDKMKMTRPAGAAKTGAGASVTKADILHIIEKAVEPIRKENEKLRDTLRKKEYEEIAKSEFSDLGSTQEMTEIFKSLEGLPSEARKSIIKTLKQTQAMKKEAGAMLTSVMGSSRPAAGSGQAEFAELVEKKIAEVRKSDKGKKITDPMILKAMAITAVSEEYPELAKKVDAEQRANMVKRQMGVA